MPHSERAEQLTIQVEELPLPVPPLSSSLQTPLEQVLVLAQ